MMLDAINSSRSVRDLQRRDLVLSTAINRNPFHVSGAEGSIRGDAVNPRMDFATSTVGKRLDGRE